MRSEPLSNDSATLATVTQFDGPALRFDFPSFRIGVAEYEMGPTGCTVFHFPGGAMTAVDIRGGSPGTVGNYNLTDAICLAGGSLYGLEAATGVAAELFAESGYSTAFDDIVAVSGAIIYDFVGRENAIYPDKGLGRAAVRAAQTGQFPLGARGAGRLATVGQRLAESESESSGQGGAFTQVGPTKVAVFSVVNALGAIVNRQGEVVRGNRNPATGQRRRLVEMVRSGSPSPGNTTLTVVVTNQKLSRWALTQFGRQVHSSLARAIQPFHTVYDGDVLYAVTTAEVENEALDPIALGAVASEVAWDAVLSIADTY